MFRAGTLALLLTVVAVEPHMWEMHFIANPLNVGIQTVTECKGKDGLLGFYAVDYVQIDAEDSSLVTRRQTTPKGERCTVVASVQRNADGATGDPANDYIGESSIIVEIQ